MLSTVAGESYATRSPRRGRRILFSLRRGRDSVACIRDCPRVALTILAEGDVAITARGAARLVDDLLPQADYVAIELAVDAVDDHRQAAFGDTGGVGREWRDDVEREALGAGWRPCAVRPD